jgi:hypothetical protein
MIIRLAQLTPWPDGFWLAGIYPAGPQSRWPLGFDPFQVNGPQVMDFQYVLTWFQNRESKYGGLGTRRVGYLNLDPFGLKHA